MICFTIAPTVEGGRFGLSGGTGLSNTVASDAANYITGQNIVVNGGHTFS